MLKHSPVHPHAAKAVITNKIRGLCAEFPECWHLVWQAEDRCRRDELERIRRQLTRARIAGTIPMNIEFDPQPPWIGAFTFAARDGEYWAKHVVRPAQTFLARGGAGKSMSKEAAEGVLMDKDTQKRLQPAAGEGKSRNARKRRAERMKHEEPSKWSSKGGSSWTGGGTTSWSSPSWSTMPAPKGNGAKGSFRAPKEVWQHVHHDKRR